MAGEWSHAPETCSAPIFQRASSAGIAAMLSSLVGGAPLPENVPMAQKPMVEDALEWVLQTVEAARNPVRQGKIDRLLPNGIGPSVPCSDLDEPDRNRAREYAVKTRLAVDDRRNVLIDTGRERKPVCEIADADLGADDLRTQNDHIVEIRERQIEA